jgi:hypothetical protein
MIRRAAGMKNESIVPVAVRKEFLKTMTSDCPGLYAAFKRQMHFSGCLKKKQAARITPRGLAKWATV